MPSVDSGVLVHPSNPQYCNVDSFLSVMEQPIAKMAVKYNLSLAERQDLIQVGRIAAWKAHGAYDPSRGATLVTYASKAASNAMNTEYRKIKDGKIIGRSTMPENVSATAAVSYECPADDEAYARAEEEITRIDISNPLEEMLAHESGIRITGWYERLPEIKRQIFCRHFLKFQQITEIAQVLGQSHQSVYKHKKQLQFALYQQIQVA